MKKPPPLVQYTVRGVPREVDIVLRRKAAKRKVSLNQVIVEELCQAAIGAGSGLTFRTWWGSGLLTRPSTRSWGPGGKSTWTSGNESRVDTNRLTDLLRGDAQLAERLGACDEVWIPLVVLGEIKAGLQGGTQRHRNEALLQRFLAKSPLRCSYRAAKLRSTTPESSYNSNAPAPPYQITTCGLRRSRSNTTSR